MRHLGDITKIHGYDVPPVDIITGGSPCQDLSVAGKREGLAGERSGLFMEQIRIVKEMRENDRANGRTAIDIRPRWMVWENVPGAFSSPGKRNGEDHRGEDFQAVISEIVKIANPDAPDVPLPSDRKWSKSGCIMGIGADGQPFSVAYRLHDAQFWGVPQRRKRIALVADFAGLTAPEILFERESVCGDSTESGEQREGTSRSLAGCPDQTISFQERAGKPGGGKGILIQEERTGALSTLNNQSVCYGISSYDSNAMKSSNPHSGIYEAETSRTLDLNGGSPACNQGGIAVVCLEGNGTRPSHQGDGYAETEISYTLNSIERHAVAFRKEGHPQTAEQGQGWKETEVNDTLNAFDSGEVRTPTVIIENHPQDSRCKIKEDGIFQTLDARMGMGGGNVPMVMETYQKTTGSLCASGYDKLGTQEAMNDMFVAEGGCAWDGTQTSPTLTANNANGAQRMPDKENFNAVITTSHGGFMVNADDSGVAHTLEASDHKDPQTVCYALDRASFNQGKNALYEFSVQEEMAQTVVSRGPGAVCARDSKGVGNQYVNESKCIVDPYQNTVGSLCASDSKGVGSVVRRLTPLECERLQGFPDGWTDIGDWIDGNGKKHKGESDSPRYKALGNSIALPFWAWMAERMVKYCESKKPTMASLFDGIGGFPLVYTWAGCEPVWASEIEEFPIAVTKMRFPDEEKGGE